MDTLLFGSARAPISIFPLGGKRPSRLPSTLNSFCQVCWNAPRLGWVPAPDCSGAGSSRERLMPVATGAPRDESVGAGWHGGTRGVTLTPTLSLRERGKSPTLPPSGWDDTALRRAQDRRGGRGLFSYQRRWGLLASHAARGRAGFKPAPTAPRYAVWGRTRGVTLTPTVSRQAETGQAHPFGKLRAGSTLSRRGRGGKSPLLRSLFSCVTGSRSPGGRATGVCGVDGRAIGVRLAPVLLESFPDPALGGCEIRGCGLVLLFFLVALGGWVLSESGGPGGSVLASLFSGLSSPGAVGAVKV